MIKQLTLWQEPVDRKVLEIWGRKTVVAQTEASVPPQPMDKLFSPGPLKPAPLAADATPAQKKAAEVRETWTEKLNEVTKNKTWTSYTPESLQQRYAEHAWLLRAYAQSDYVSLGRAWYAAFAPKGHFITPADSAEVLYVVKAYDLAFVALPAERHTNGTWSIDPKVFDLYAVSLYQVISSEQDLQRLLALHTILSVSISGLSESLPAAYCLQCCVMLVVESPLRGSV